MQKPGSRVNIPQFLTSQVLVYCKLFYLDFFMSSFYQVRAQKFRKIGPFMSYYKDVTDILNSSQKLKVAFFYYYFLYQDSSYFRFFWKKKKEGKNLKTYCVLLIPIAMGKELVNNIDSHLVFLFEYLKFSLVLLLNWTDLYSYNISMQGILFDIQRYPFYLYFKRFFGLLFQDRYRPIALSLPSLGSNKSKALTFFYLLRLFQLPTISNEFQ